MRSFIGRWDFCRRMDDGSRMSREVHVRFCERLEVKSLRPTHPYIPVGRGFLYLVAVMDWSSRAVLAWRLSNTMDASFCVSALEEALTRFGTPEIFNTDQGSQPGFNQSSQRSCQLTVSARQMPLQVFSSQGFCEAS